MKEITDRTALRSMGESPLTLEGVRPHISVKKLLISPFLCGNISQKFNLCFFKMKALEALYMKSDMKLRATRTHLHET